MTKFCPSCGEKLVDSARFCKNCGTSLDGAVPNRNYEVPIVEKEYSISIIAGYICALLFPLIGIIIGIYLITRKDSQKANRHGKYMIGAAVVVWFVSFMKILW